MPKWCPLLQCFWCTFHSLTTRVHGSMQDRSRSLVSGFLLMACVAPAGFRTASNVAVGRLFAGKLAKLKIRREGITYTLKGVF